MTSPLSHPAAGLTASSSSSMDAIAGPSALSAAATDNAEASSSATQLPSSSSAPQGMMKPPHRAISPPTPAPSPQPDARRLLRSQNARASHEEASGIAGPSGSQQDGSQGSAGISDDAAPLVKLIARELPSLSQRDRQALLSQLVDSCSARDLAFLSALISPRLKVDFLSALPIEVSLHIVSYLDDPRTLARASCVSRFWRSLVNDEHTWKVMCSRYRFRQLPLAMPNQDDASKLNSSSDAMLLRSNSVHDANSTAMSSAYDTAANEALENDGASANSLASLYKAYRARGLDAAAAFAELKTLHELFLSKRAQELSAEERRRQFHAMRNNGVPMLPFGDSNDFSAQLATSTMGEEDRQFYLQLEEYVREQEARRAGASGATNERSLQDEPQSVTDNPESVGWLSSGPSIASRLEDTANPSTPTAAHSSMIRNAIASPTMPLREVGRSLNTHLVSPTSRFGTMTSGILTSLWDRTGGASADQAGQSSAHDSESGHVPSTGDHGHSSAGHTGPQDDDEEMEMDDEDHEDLAVEAADEPTISLSSSRPANANDEAGSMPTLHVEKRGRSAMASEGDVIDGAQPSMRAHHGQRSATSASQPVDIASPSSSGRAYSSAFEHLRPPGRQHAGSPFSYKNHFKLAYLTEQNWLRGGRLLTQHVSSVDASPEGNIVTSLSIDEEWIVVGMANAKVHAFDARTGLFVKTLTGHSSGVWCLALISASSPFGSGRGAARSSKMHGKSRSRAGFMQGDQFMDEDATSASSAYPYEGDRPFYTPTPDLNLIHHDPRPAANVYTPDGFTFSSSMERPTMPTPRSFKGFATTSSGQNDAREDTMYTHHTFSRTPADARPGESQEGEDDRPDFGSRPHSSRGAGLGSNFGSPCGSVAGYGNEHAIVVSSGCDREVRVWDLATGECKYILSGHRSTVRCLRVFDERPIAITGSRDGTMRVWNVETGQQVHLLAGHQHSVRCLDLAGNLVASASYDCTGRIWNVDTGKCVHVLRGHYHQLYAIAFDGTHVATGSLDTTVRLWSAQTGECLALLQAHSSLVGQLQLTDSTLITGGSDGKVVVFSLKQMKIMYQLLAHGNSVTCLQFDDRFIVTGGNDGKVKLWNFRTGEFVRELCESSEQVWKVSFRDDKCVVLCKRNGKTAIDVISFRPIEEST